MNDRANGLNDQEVGAALLDARQAMTSERTAPDMALRLIDIKERLDIVQQFFAAVMVRDQDYGVIPGTLKPSLLKPGAEKLCELYGYAIAPAEIVETADAESGYYRARVTQPLLRRDGSLVAAGVGEANTKEGRYRWRDAQRRCPECGAAAIIKGRAEYGGGWVCFQKRGGCGAKFREQDERITGQPLGRVENDDPWTLWNTVLKMGKKRALVDAALSATRSSGLFTQDAEDLREWIEGDAHVVSAPARPRSAPPPRASRGAALPPPAAAAEAEDGPPPADGYGGRQKLRRILTASKRELSAEQFGAVMHALATSYPAAASDDRATLVIGRLSDVQVDEIISMLDDGRDAAGAASPAGDREA